MLKKINVYLVLFLLMNSSVVVFPSLEEFYQKKVALDYQRALLEKKIYVSLDVKGLKQIRTLMADSSPIIPLQKEFDHLVSQQKALYEAYLPLFLSMVIEEQNEPTKEEFEHAEVLAECQYQYEKRLSKLRELNRLFDEVACFIKDAAFVQKYQQIKLAVVVAKKNDDKAESFFKKEQHKRMVARRNSLRNLL